MVTVDLRGKFERCIRDVCHRALLRESKIVLSLYSIRYGNLGGNTKGNRAVNKKSLFPVQRVAVIVTSRVATIFFSSIFSVW